MSNQKLIEKIIEYLENNKNVESIDIKNDSENLLLWIENWKKQNKV